MGHGRGMEIARRVAVDCSDVVISNADEYNHTYQQPPLDTKQNLQKFNGAYGALSGIAANYKPNHEAKPRYWIEVGEWGVRPKNLALMLGTEISTLADPIHEQLRADGNRRKPLDDPGKKIRFGKCFVTAGIAVYSLLKEPEFRGLGLHVEVCQTSGAAHYFVVVGRAGKSRTEPPDPATINNYSGAWGTDAFIVDLWQANLNQDFPLWGRTMDNEFLNPAVVDPGEWAYIEDAASGKLSVVAQMVPPFQSEVEALG